MTTIQLIVVFCYLAAMAALMHAIATRTKIGSPLIAGVLCAVFTAFTLIQIGQEGLITFWTNHTANLTGVQVWWDLLMATVIAFIFIAPRARAVGMNVPLWGVFVVSTASVGLLAMVARLFWLERHSETAAQ